MYECDFEVSITRKTQIDTVPINNKEYVINILYDDKNFTVVSAVILKIVQYSAYFILE